jgi:hypothetical protein
MMNETIRLAELEIQISGARPTRVVFKGKSNHRDPEAVLRPLFANIAKQLNEPEALLELHFEHLEFFNSSTITAVIQFVKDLRRSRVTTRVTYNASHKWQKIFFDALGILEKSDDRLQITAVFP